MKKPIFILLLLIIQQLVFSQERVTSIKDDSLNFIRYIHHYDNEDYLVSIYQNDQLRIDKLDENNKPYFFCLKELTGIYAQNNLTFFDKIFTYSRNIGSETFSYEKGKQIISFLPFGQSIETLNPPIWQYKNRKYALLKTGTISQYYNTKRDYSKQLPDNLNYIVPDDDVIYSSVKNSDFIDYLMYYVYEDKFEILASGVTSQTGVFFEDGFAYYIDSDGAIVKYDIKKKDRNDMGIYSKYKKSNNQLSIVDNNLIIYQANVDSTFIEIYDLKTNKKTYEKGFKFIGTIFQDKIYFVGNTVLLKSKIGKLAILNTLDNADPIIKDININFNFVEWPIVNNRYLTYLNKKDLYVYDLTTGIETINVFSTNSSETNVWDVQIINRNNYNLLSFIRSSKKQNTLFKFDPSDLSVKPFNIDVPSNSGLTLRSNIYNINNEVVLGAQDIYNITNNVKKINSKPLFKEIYSYYPYAKEEKGFSYKTIDTSTYNFYLYDGISNSLEAKINKKANNYIYYQTSENIYHIENTSLVVYNKKTNETKSVGSNITGFDFINSMIVYKDELYFSNSGYLNKIDKNGKFIQYNFEIKNDFSSYVFLTNDRLYLISNNNISYVEYDTFVELFSFDISVDYYYLEGNNILVHGFSYKTYTYNTFLISGLDEISKIESLDGVYMLRKNSSDLFTVYRDNDSENYIFDKNNLTAIKLPNEISKSNVAALWATTKDTFALISSGALMELVKLKDNFDTYEMMGNVNSSFDRNGQIYTVNDNAIFLGNSDILTIDKYGKIAKMSNIQGIPEMEPNALVKDNFVYFFGLEQQFGRQVYKLNLNDLTQTYQIDLPTAIQTFPNPSTNSIRFGIDEAAEISIRSQLGIEVLKTFLIPGNSIDVKNLASGFYLVEIKTNSKRYSSKFIKIN